MAALAAATFLIAAAIYMDFTVLLNVVKNVLQRNFKAKSHGH